MATPEEMAASMIANLPEKTGKSLADWIGVVRSSGLAKHGEIVKFLKSEHGMTHGYANLVSHEARRAGKPETTPDDLVANQYAGAKAELRLILDRILEIVGEFGNDVEIAPKKANVSLRRSKQFALVQPSTRTRVDLGINLKGREPEGRLVPAGSLGMVTHKVALGDPSDVDDDVVGWLRDAYDGA